MKKVLIVTPNWPPVTYPDLQRVRMALPYMESFGWEPLVLHCDPDGQGGYKEPALLETVPKTVRTWKANVLPLEATRALGVGSYGLRSYPALSALGRRLIEEEKPDLIFFS